MIVTFKVFEISRLRKKKKKKKKKKKRKKERKKKNKIVSENENQRRAKTVGLFARSFRANHVFFFARSTNNAWKEGLLVV